MCVWEKRNKLKVGRKNIWSVDKRHYNGIKKNVKGTKVKLKRPKKCLEQSKNAHFSAGNALPFQKKKNFKYSNNHLETHRPIERKKETNMDWLFVNVYVLFFPFLPPSFRQLPSLSCVHASLCNVKILSSFFYLHLYLLKRSSTYGKGATQFSCLLILGCWRVNKKFLSLWWWRKEKRKHHHFLIRWYQYLHTHTHIDRILSDSVILYRIELGQSEGKKEKRTWGREMVGIHLEYE